jgi:hypothetical protein
MKYFLVFLALLNGCGAAQDSQQSAQDQAIATNHGYGWYYDSKGSNELRLRTHPDATGYDIAFVEKAYEDVMACMNMRVPGPLILFISGAAQNYNGSSGAYHPDTKTVILDTQFGGWTLHHELVHHILWLATNDTGWIPDGSIWGTHTSPYFDLCGRDPRINYSSS